jgi:hypothetical protein
MSLATTCIGNGSQLTGIDAAARANTIQNGNSNVFVYANADVATSVGGTANVFVVTANGADVTGTVSASGDVTGANIYTSGEVSASGAITGSDLSAPNLVVNNISSDDSAYVTVNDGLSVHGDIDLIGDITVTGTSNFGSINNVKITGGTNGQYLSTDGAGNLAFSNASPDITQISNGNSNVTITGQRQHLNEQCRHMCQCGHCDQHHYDLGRYYQPKICQCEQRGFSANASLDYYPVVLDSQGFLYKQPVIATLESGD